MQSDTTTNPPPATPNIPTITPEDAAALARSLPEGWRTAAATVARRRLPWGAARRFGLALAEQVKLGTADADAAFIIALATALYAMFASAGTPADPIDWRGVIRRSIDAALPKPRR